MHELYWKPDLSYGVGYANARAIGDDSQVYFFVRSLGQLGASRLPTRIVQVAAGAHGWYFMGRDDHLYYYTWEGQPRWVWKRPPLVQGPREELVSFDLGMWRPPALMAAAQDRVWVSGGARLRCLDEAGTLCGQIPLPRKKQLMWDLTEEVLRGPLASVNAQFGPGKKGTHAVGYFRWDWEGAAQSPRRGEWIWTREEHGADEGNEIDVATALAANAQGVYAGTCAGEVLGWSLEGRATMRMDVEQTVWNLCLDESGLRAAQSGNNITYFKDGAITSTSSHQYERPSVAAIGEDLVLWTRYETWTVDGQGVVQWAARWPKPIVACVPAAGGFSVLTGSCVYRFGAQAKRGVAQAAADEEAPRDEAPVEISIADAQPIRREPVPTTATIPSGAVPEKKRTAGAENGQGSTAARTEAETTSQSKKHSKQGRARNQADHASPKDQSNVQARATSKTSRILELVRRPAGATLEELQAATGWQAHSVRGFLSAVLGQRMGLKVNSTKRSDGTRRYRVGRKM